MSRINELKESCPWIAKEIESLINNIASYKNIINEENKEVSISAEINLLSEKIEKELRLSLNL